MVSDDTIPTRRELKDNDAAWWNVIKDALSSNFLPRNASGVPTDMGGSMGSTTYQFLKAFIASGHWAAGDVQIIHPYDGDVLPGQGWMKMDGRLINETNYDIEHGAGSWDIYVVSSLLDGKYLPSMTNKYGIGKATTPQTGAGAFTSVGNTAHQISINHSHQWIDVKANNADDLFSSASAEDDLNATTIGTEFKNATFYGIWLPANLSINVALGGGPLDFTAHYDGSTSPALDHQPESMQGVWYLRVI